MKPEVWRALRAWPYEVSSHGKVRRIETKKLRKLSPDKDGYLRVTLNRKNRLISVRVHILVCSGFVGPKPFEDAQVRHKDGSVDNNYYENLEWGTSLDNHDDRRKHGHDRNGEKNQAALFTNAEVVQMRQMYATGTYTQWDLARKYGTTQGIMSGILRHETYNAEGKAKGDFTQRGEARHNAAVNPEKVRQIRSLCEQGELSQIEIGKLFGIGQMAVSKIYRRVTWKHIK